MKAEVKNAELRKGWHRQQYLQIAGVMPEPLHILYCNNGMKCDLGDAANWALDNVCTHAPTWPCPSKFKWLWVFCRK
jgi:hypothetical protein